MSTLAQGSVIGGYRIEDEAGHGGMGVVYRATQLGLDRTVALKVIAPELAQDASFRERFKRESRIAASIEHSNVIPVYEAGEEQGLLFITMRFIPGTDLREVIRSEQRIEPRRAVRIIGQVCSALDAAHARGLVHRDVKPANVLIAHEGGEEHAYLTDFGLTKHRESKSGMTATGMWVGTIDYMAPEQIQGAELDARSDVYAVGCVLFHALTGDLPFTRDTDVATMWAHVADPPPSLAEHVPELSPELDRTVRRALAKEPAERYQSAGDLAYAAAAGLEGRPATRAERTVATGPAAPTAAPTTSPAVPAGDTLARRRRIPVAGRAAALVGLVGLVAVALAVAGVFSGDGGDGQPELRGLRGDDVRLKPIRVHSPAGVALGEGAVWVSSYERDTVSRIDPDSAEVEKRIEVGDGPGGLAVGEGAVWVSQSDDGTLGRVDLKSEQLVGRPVEAPSGSDDSVAVGEGAVWVTLPDQGAVARLDPASGKVRQRISVPNGVADEIAVGEGGVWVANFSKATIVRIDPRTNRPGRPIRVGRRAKDGFRGELAAGEGAVWVATLDDEKLVAVDPRSQKVVREIDFRERGFLESDLAIGAGLVWVVDETPRLIRIDPESGRRVGGPVPAGTAGVGDIEIGEGAVWIDGSTDSHTITRVGP